MDPRISSGNRGETRVAGSRRPWLFLAAVLVSGLVLMILASPASAVPSSSSPDIVLPGEVQTQVDSLQAQVDAVQAEIDALDLEVERMAERYNELKLRLDDINGQLVELRRSQAIAQEKYRRQEAAVNARLVAAYKLGNDNLLEILLATESFNDLVNRLVLIAKVAVYDQGLADDLKAAAEDLSKVEETIRAKKAEELAIREQLDINAQDIEARLAERTATLEGLDEQIAGVIEEERVRQEEERKRLEAEIRSLVPNWQSYAGPLPQTSDELQSQLVETAVFYLGIPYLWAGSKPSTGMDCSGFVLYVFAQHGVVLPHFAAYQCAMGSPVARADIQPGDIVGFGNPIHHVGIYVGDGLFIHAPRTGDVIRITPLSERSDLTAIRRFPIQARAGQPSLN